MNDEYLIKDLSEASFLLVKGQIINSIQKIGQVCWFSFNDKQLCEKLSKEFWFGSPLIDAKKYSEAIKTLKNRIFSYQ